MSDRLHGFFVTASSANSTCASFVDGKSTCLPSLDVPFYFAMRQNLFTSVSDNILALAAPIIAHWSFSLFFHCLDMSGWIWLDKYRIHESDEVKSRNRVSRSQVFWAVIFQHVMQTVLGYYWLSERPTISPSRCIMEMEAVERTLAHLVRWSLGQDAANYLLGFRGADITYWLYWWVIPAAQLFFSLFIVDTWQYFVHRGMHSNKFFYKHVHSVHHRLYVPYAFGTQYSHPLEGFLIDSLGSVVAETIANLSVRQTIFLFTFTTMKSIDDHCGYRFPFDPFQISGNNSDFHDIHHQSIGIKSNFSQPFFIHWDTILGTKMTRKEFEDRRQKIKTT